MASVSPPISRPVNREKDIPKRWSVCGTRPTRPPEDRQKVMRTLDIPARFTAPHDSRNTTPRWLGDPLGCRAPEGDDSKRGLRLSTAATRPQRARAGGGKFRNPWDTSTSGSPLGESWCHRAPRTPSSDAVRQRQGSRGVGPPDRRRRLDLHGRDGPNTSPEYHGVRSAKLIRHRGRTLLWTVR